MARFQGLKVLLAEDEPLAALGMEELLTSEGHAVSLAEDGLQALALARKESFDVLVTDLAMPGMGGLDLIRTLRKEQPDLPIVVMTACLSRAAAEELLEHPRPPVALLQKPFALRLLTAALALVQPRPPAALVA